MKIGFRFGNSAGYSKTSILCSSLGDSTFSSEIWININLILNELLVDTSTQNYYDKVIKRFNFIKCVLF